jgi:hypothetical protein
MLASHFKIRSRFTEFSRCFASFLLIDLQQKDVHRSNKTASTLFLNNLVENLEETEEGENIMGSVSEFVSAMAVLGILIAWKAREEERNSRQEEEFVPFRLPPLPQQEQSMPEPLEEVMPGVAMAASATHAL